MDLQKIKQILNNRAPEVFDKLGMKCEIFGDNIYSTCPVHESSDNPRAFSFNSTKGIWKCWTRECQHEYKNDIFGLIRGALSNKQGQDVGFSKALYWACELINVNNTTTPSPELNDHEDFCKLVNSLSNVEEKKLHKSIKIEELQYPSKYFLNRGFSEKTLLHFEVGDCFNKHSIMNERAVIPIHDENGTSLVGLIGRSIKEYRSPKFLLYPKKFSKSDFFYNFHRAKEHIENTKTVFIVEGQGDVWKLYEAGIYNAISIFGRVLSKEQETKLNKMSLTHIIVLTDNDQAGREAKIQMQRQLSRMYKLSFPQLFAKDIGEMSVEQIQNKILTQIKGLVI